MSRPEDTPRGVRDRLARAIRAVAGVLGAVALVAVAATASPTAAVWEDRGRTVLPVSAGDPAPESEAVVPITSGANTVFQVDENDPETWAWTNNTGTPWPAAQDFCITLPVKTDTTELSAWELELHFPLSPWDWDAPFNAQMTSQIYYSANYSLTPADDYETSGLVYMRPDTDMGEWASSTVTYTVAFCAQTGEPAYFPPGPDTYEITSLSVADSGGQARVTLVVTGVTWYFIGYTATFNLKDLLDQSLADGEITQAQYDAWLPTKIWYGPGTSGATGADYNVTVTPYNVFNTYVNEHVPILLQVTGSQYAVE